MEKADYTHKPSAYESEIYPSHLQGAKDSVAVLTNANAFVVMPDTAMGS